MLVMVVSNSIPGSSTLKYDDAINVILREKTHRKSLGGSTLGSSLNAQRTGRTTERGNNSRNCDLNQEESQRGRGLNLKDREIAGTVVN